MIVPLNKLWNYEDVYYTPCFCQLVNEVELSAEPGLVLTEPMYVVSSPPPSNGFWTEGGREGGREGRKGGEGREGGREGERERERERGREGRRGRREGGREGERVRGERGSGERETEMVEAGEDRRRKMGKWRRESPGK